MPWYFSIACIVWALNPVHWRMRKRTADDCSPYRSYGNFWFSPTTFDKKFICETHRNPQVYLGNKWPEPADCLEIMNRGTNIYWAKSLFIYPECRGVGKNWFIYLSRLSQPEFVLSSTTQFFYFCAVSRHGWCSSMQVTLSMQDK